MKFKLKTSYEGGYLGKDLEVLESLGFQFTDHGRSNVRYVREDRLPVIEINTIEELEVLRKKVRAPLIIHDGEIEIYDSNRE